MEEKENPAEEAASEGERAREADLNHLFPGRDVDLNRLFPDDGTRKLLQDLRRNRRDIDRFIKSLHMEED